MCHFGAHLLCTSVLFRDACTRKNWWIFEGTPKGEVISDLKRFIANLVLNQPEFWSWISEKNCNIFSQKKGREWGGQRPFGGSPKSHQFLAVQASLKSLIFLFLQLQLAVLGSMIYQTWTCTSVLFWSLIYVLLQLHCAFVYVTFELLDTLSDMDNVHWTCSGLLFWSLIYVLRQSALRGTWPGFLPWLSLSQHLTTRLSCTEAQNDDYDDYDDDDHDD